MLSRTSVDEHLPRNAVCLVRCLIAERGLLQLCVVVVHTAHALCNRHGKSSEPLVFRERNATTGNGESGMQIKGSLGFGRAADSGTNCSWAECESLPRNVWHIGVSL